MNRVVRGMVEWGVSVIVFKAVGREWHYEREWSNVRVSAVSK